MLKALVLFSGGMDSVFCLHTAMRAVGRENVAVITFDYGQRHRRELKCAEFLASTLIVRRSLVEITLQSKSPLMRSGEPMPEYADYKEAEEKLQDQIEPAFVPMRNPVLLAIAANHALAMGATTIYVGISKEDGATVPDCSPEFIGAFEDMCHWGLGAAELTFITPLLAPDRGKVWAIQHALNELPGCYASWAFSHTSYFDEYPPKSRDHAMVCREDAFEKAGYPDPLIVRANMEGLMPLPNRPEYRKFLNGIDKLAKLTPGYGSKVSFSDMLAFENYVRKNPNG